MFQVEPVRIETVLHVSGPYEEGLHPAYRSMGGKWCPECCAWHFETRYEAELRTLNWRWLGDDGARVEQVFLRIVLRAGATIASCEGELRLGPLVIARLRGQEHSRVRVQDRAHIESGLINKPKSGYGGKQFGYVAPADAPGVLVWGPLGIDRAKEVCEELLSERDDFGAPMVVEVNVFKVENDSTQRGDAE